METNIKCFIDGIKPTNEMNEDELRKFSDAARYEIKRLIDMQHRAAEEYNALKAQLAEANEKLADYEGSFDNLNDQISELTTKEKEATTSYSREYRKATILKGALKIIKEKYDITDVDCCAAMVSVGNGELDIDTLLYQLSK